MSLVKGITKQILSRFPYRYINVGREFYKWLNTFERMKTMTREQIREAQFASFANMVSYAYGETKFYRRLYDDHGFHPNQLKDLSDIRRIPVISRAMVKEAGMDIVAAKYASKRLFVGSTSGSTGTSLTVYSNRALEQREWASTCFLWSSAGYRPGDGRVELRGLFPGGEEYKIDPYHRVFRVNVSKLTPNNIHSILERIEETGYEFIHGYPSSVSLASKLVLDNGLVHAYKPKAVLLASENVFDYQLNTIRKAFPDALLNAHYGQSERVVTASWNDGESGYHFNPLYGYVEFRQETNAVIGTSFINDVTPFIRYELNDIASTENPEPSSRYLFPAIKSIDGRVGEIMYKPNGDMVSSALVAIAVRGTKSVTACKLIQHRLNEIEILVETVQGQSEVMEELKPVLQRLRSIFTDAMIFTISVVDHIPRGPSGKFKSVEVLIDQAGVPV
ncbi:hypothetical protein [Paenibacillus sp. DMB20]|uniref:hypothetical protein n=1 Tax=Paenibacillus sp. DMB20 TaxID=1642570 RepID=UPI00062749AC|nr:hypothetical protein [Paenibacillus sp. DMB20]KKO51009.1 hypothetical protein XI25_28765 [Paenibacillus sp. DMB20]